MLKLCQVFLALVDMEVDKEANMEVDKVADEKWTLKLTIDIQKFDLIDNNDNWIPPAKTSRIDLIILINPINSINPMN